jgi:hypothetical protein
MYQVFNADWSVSVLRLRSVEQALELTQDVLGYILAGDSDRVAALSGFEISPRLRSTTLAGRPRSKLRALRLPTPTFGRCRSDLLACAAS